MALSAEAGQSADALRRVAAQLTSSMGKLLTSPSPPETARVLLGEAFEALRGKLKLDEGELQALADATRWVCAQVGELPLARPAPFSGAGEGELLSALVNPAACKGCGLCVAACEPEALKRALPGEARLGQVRELWKLWERLPD